MNHFTSIRIEGSIFSADILEKLPTLKGQKPADFGYDVPVKDEIARAWADAQDYWRIFQRRVEDLSEISHGTTETRNKWMVPFLSLLGYNPDVQQKGEEVMGRNFAISHRDTSRNGYPIHIMGCRDSLDQKRTDSGPRMSPHGLVQEFLNLKEEHLYAIVTNGLQLRLLRDSSRLVKLSYIEFDLEQMFTDGIFSDFALLYRLLHATRMPVNEESINESLIELYHQDSLDSGTRIREGLSAAVRDTIEKLGCGFLRHPENEALRQAIDEGELDAREYYHCCLRLVYRILFLMVAEDRNLLFPPGASREKQKIYYDYYSLSRLRRLAEKSYLCDSTDQDYWINLRQVFQLFENEELAGRMDLVPLGGMLFDEQSLGLLASASLDNRSLADALRSFTWFTEPATGQTIRINYAALNVEELGSIYEFLLEMTPELQLESNTFSLIIAAGNERKTSGSYYTPECLVFQLLKTALDPVIDQRTKDAAKQTTNADRKPAMEEALLKIKICDPACGSGHFLIGAANRLARRLCEIRFDGEEPSPQAYRHALREVITHCIYGIDINPMSVELCKVSLWMEAMEPGKPLGFLDHHIKSGNSLLGTTPALLSRGIPDAAFKAIEGDDKTLMTPLKRRNRQERDAKIQDLFGHVEAEWSYQHAFEDAIHEVDGLDDENIQSLEKKQLAYEEFQHSTSYVGGKRLHDAWCAAFVCPKVDSENCITSHLIYEMQRDPNRCPKEKQKLIDDLSAQYQFFHWHIEFPDVFQPLDSFSGKDSKGWIGGFDCILGNPPWEKLQTEEIQYFSARAPHIAKLKGAKRKAAIKELREHDPSLMAEWTKQKRFDAAAVSFIRTSNYYPLTGVGKFNSYALFAELTWKVVRKSGRVGCIVPTGIATDDTTKVFFQKICNTSSLISLYDFENRLAVFPGVHRMFKFSLLTLLGEGGQSEGTMKFAFFLQSASDLNDGDKIFELTRDDIELLNPNTGNCPVFRLKKDALLARDIYSRVSILRYDDCRKTPYELRAWRLINTTDDSEHFHPYTEETLQIPLIEAKTMHQFDHRYGSFESSDDVHVLSSKEKADCALLSKARNYLSRSYFEERLPDRLANQGWFLTARNITNAANERTVIASMIPRSAGCQDTPYLELESGSAVESLELLACLNSFILDYIARQKVGGTHLSLFILYQLPVVHGHFMSESIRSLVQRNTLELVYTAFDLVSLGHDLNYTGPPFVWDDNRRFEIRCELDAAFFHLYGIDNFHDVDYIMETFPIVKRRDIAKHGSYLTKERILEIYQEMARCTAEGREYRSALNPPPGPPSDADGHFIPMSEWDTKNWPSHIHRPKGDVKKKTIGYGEKLYAYSYGRQVDGDRTTLNLEVVRSEDTDTIPFEDGINNERYRVLSDLPTYYASVTYKNWDEVMLGGLGPDFSEGWIQLKVEKSKNPNLMMFEAATETVRLEGDVTFNDLDADEMERLRARFALPAPSDPGLVSQHLNSVQVPDETFVAVYNVGQGLCSAICDAKTSEPILYFNFGCGCYENKDTRPEKLEFCFHNNPLIILSHWHADHYIAASLLDERALDQKWLAPHREIGPTATGVVAKLYLKGNVLLWPAGTGYASLTWGKIIKCVGKGLNCSDLAMDIFIGKQSDPDFRVLLPGDAGYGDIPDAEDVTYDGLVVSHHGGSASSTVMATAESDAPFVLSYGEENSYEHPRDEHLVKLKEAGWTRRLNTIEGHIAIGLPDGSSKPKLRCYGKNCNLQIEQI